MSKINLETLIYLVIITLIAITYYRIILQDNKKLDLKNITLNKNKKTFTLENSEVDYLFSSVGLDFTGYHYNIFRIILAVIFLLLNGLEAGNLYIIFIFYFISIPKRYVFKYKTPFYKVLELLRKEYREKQNTEIYNAIIQLKNICISTKDKPLSSDFMLEHLGKFANYTKPLFIQTLAIWRLGDEEKAVQHFSKSIDTKIASEFARFLTKLDRTDPSELVEQLELLQSSVREIKTTNTLKRQEIISNIMFIPIITATLIILLNFIVITIWLNIQI